MSGLTLLVDETEIEVIAALNHSHPRIASFGAGQRRKRQRRSEGVACRRLESTMERDVHI